MTVQNNISEMSMLETLRTWRAFAKLVEKPDGLSPEQWAAKRAFDTGDLIKRLVKEIPLQRKD